MPRKDPPLRIKAEAGAAARRSHSPIYSPSIGPRNSPSDRDREVISAAMADSTVWLAIVKKTVQTLALVYQARGGLQAWQALGEQQRNAIIHVYCYRSIARSKEVAGAERLTYYQKYQQTLEQWPAHVIDYFEIVSVQQLVSALDACWKAVPSHEILVAKIDNLVASHLIKEPDSAKVGAADQRHLLRAMTLSAVVDQCKRKVWQGWSQEQRETAVRLQWYTHQRSVVNRQ